MTKYLIFKNQPGSGQTNVPGSREQMACNIAKVVTQEDLADDFFVAYPSESPDSTFAGLKKTANYSVEIDDERAELWKKEIASITNLSQAIDDAIGQAYSVIVGAAINFGHACEKSKNFKDIEVSEHINIDRAFEAIESNLSFEIAEIIEEIFEVETLSNHYA